MIRLHRKSRNSFPAAFIFSVRIASIIFALLPLVCNPAHSQDGAVSDAGDEMELEMTSVGADSNPMKPVAFSFREDYYKISGDAWKNVVTLRVDQLILEKDDLLGHRKGVILRADLPMVASHSDGSTRAGLGDFYGQFLLVPPVTGNLVFAFGSGLIFPTATGDELGMGKWIAAPAAVPAYIFPHQGYAYIKVQDWISFEGDSGRPDVHYLTVTPTFLWRIAKAWWMMIDGESYTDWEMYDRTSFKAGFLIGHMFTPTIGLSLKTELPFGGHRQGDWTLKAVFFLTRY